MAGLNANYALAAKVRAMYGRRLMPSDYRELLRKQSVNEVAAYLKQQPGYNALLSDTNENLVHRGQLESILRRQLFEEYIRMSFFIDESERDFYEYVVTDMEIDEILSCIRFINAGRQGEYIFSLPSFFAKRASFDLYALAKVKTFPDLIEFLQGTPYQAILKGFEADEAGKIDSIRIEIAFKRYFYDRIFSLIDSTYSGEVRGDILNSFGMDIDLENLMIILRLRKYFNATNEYIRTLLLPYFYRLSKKDIDHILEETDASETMKAIFDTYYGRKSFKKHSFDFLEKYGLQAQYEYHKKILMFANSTPELLTSYMQLKGIELNNLINIIEGIRYALQPAEIGKLLIGMEE
ncbi:MAG: V-type ATPase subunit [Clostridia bacterium]|nr:V-type ATPase subunit [Clostridia bacterium]